MRRLSHLSLIWLICLCACQSAPESDLLVVNANIYTADDAQPKAEAMAVKDGLIVFIGSQADGEAWKAQAKEVVDLQGQTLIPGFIESHAHLLNLGKQLRQIDLMGTTSYEELIARVKAAADTTPPGTWLMGRGWHQSKWDPQPSILFKGYQTHHALSEAVPDHPVYLRHASGHAVFANQKAMEIAGIQPNQSFGEEGEIILDNKGMPTGIFSENAAGLIATHLPEESVASRVADAKAAMQECVTYGITSFTDAGAGAATLAAYEQLQSADELPIRLYVMLAGRDSVFLEKWFAKGPVIDPDHRLTIRSIKLYADGALGSRGAWLLQPYTDRPEHFGNPVSKMSYVGWVSHKALDHGFQVCTHAIGDRANREVLNRYAAAFQAGEAKDPRYRIEHAQHIHPEDIPRFAEMDVIASMQGIHFSSDRPWAIDRLGQLRIKLGAYMWQRLLAGGATIINGTDAPVEPVDPIPCFYASITRKTLKGTPEGGYEADQKMTRDQALRSYTLDGAYGSFEEDLKGSLTVGKLADFVVLSQDIMTIPEDQVLQTHVLNTYVGG